MRGNGESARDEAARLRLSEFASAKEEGPRRKKCASLEQKLQRFSSILDTSDVKLAAYFSRTRKGGNNCVKGNKRWLLINL